MTYCPKPIDTSHVDLPEEVLVLVAALAENAHDNWASQRIRDGWTFGPNRDDARKQHPCLVPYEDLPESEKVYDRRLALETLKTIIALGFHIEKIT